MFDSTTKQDSSFSAGIDVGGTKIEATLFDNKLIPYASRRIATPTADYVSLLLAISGEAEWLRQKSGEAQLPIGIGLPGLVNPVSGVSVTSNLPATNHYLRDDLIANIGGQVVMANDCKCFALSEAHGGAGAGFSSIFGLIMGTGLGGGLCQDGKLVQGFNGLVGEIGHFGIPAHLLVEFDLPLVKCGCGRLGCFETLVSGSGFSRLVKLVIGEPLEASSVIQSALQGDKDALKVYQIWLRLAAELIHTIQLFLDPECIVIGGGLSNTPRLETDLTTQLREIALPSVQLPTILKPHFGASSGGRGAALLTKNTIEFIL